MIFLYGIVAWLGLIGYGVSTKLPDCFDRIEETMLADGIGQAKVKLERYPFGISILFQQKGHKYDYFFTDDESKVSEAIGHGYTQKGECELNKQSVYFLHGHVDTTEGV